MSTTRRELLVAAAAATALPAAAAQKGKQAKVTDPGALPIVDTHQHLWDLDRFRLPWLAGNEKLNRSFVMKDYFAATEGLNVVKAVYMEVDVAPEQQLQEAEYVIDLCKRDDNPTVAAVISGRPASPGFREYITRFKGSPYIKGVRQVLHGGTPKGYCLEPDFAKGIRLLGELGMSFDLCMRSADLADAVKLVEQCPGTRFILDHCGNMSPRDPVRDEWKRQIRALAAKPRVVCKVSGIVASAKPGEWKASDLAPIVNHVLDSFGPDRVLFGGDWPVCTLAASYREWVTALKKIVRDRPREEQRRLFHDNAVRFYGLKG